MGWASWQVAPPRVDGGVSLSCCVLSSTGMCCAINHLSLLILRWGLTKLTKLVLNSLCSLGGARNYDSPSSDCWVARITSQYEGSFKGESLLFLSSEYWGVANRSSSLTQQILTTAWQGPSFPWSPKAQPRLGSGLWVLTNWWETNLGAPDTVWLCNDL